MRAEDRERERRARRRFVWGMAEYCILNGDINKNAKEETKNKLYKHVFFGEELTEEDKKELHSDQKRDLEEDKKYKHVFKGLRSFVIE